MSIDVRAHVRCCLAAVAVLWSTSASAGSIDADLQAQLRHSADGPVNVLVALAPPGVRAGSATLASRTAYIRAAGDRVLATLPDSVLQSEVEDEQALTESLGLLACEPK